VLDGRGYVHVFPAAYFGANVHSVAIATNIEYIGAAIWPGSHAKLHPAGNFLYGARVGSSPGDIDKYGIASVPLTWLYDSPYHGEYPTCDDLWIGESGESIYTACGNVFHATTSQADDMLYAGSLPLFVSSESAHYIIPSLSDSVAQGEILLIEQSSNHCAAGASEPHLCTTHAAIHDSDSFNRTALYSFAPLTVAGTNYAQRGLFVFHSADGSRKLAISRLYGMLDPDVEFYLSEL
jgi:hypothetical protein